MAGRVEEAVWEERREWIRRQQEGGLSVAQFCRNNGMHAGNFHAWRIRFAKLESQPQVGATGKRLSGRQGFVQLPLPPMTVAAGSPAWIEISLADGTCTGMESGSTPDGAK